ncbi:DUF116 domain-containing protein [Senegalia massiliensis]|uniref:DUF116 domain-containing protein n=1 Tax=Senegalia massiliensis TaxID=1720316 RepID=UPI00102F6077|nr:DUF116 domain-containing protein [Senegalia massiliensis]
MNEEKSYIKVLSYIMLATLFILILSLWIGFSENITLVKISMLIFGSIFTFILISILTIIILSKKLFQNNNLSNIQAKILYYSISFFYPLLIFTAKVTKVDKNKIRLMYTNINNLLIKTKNIKIKKENLLILLPHCIQNSKCQFKITNDINNCRKCGKCDVDEILRLKEKYDINVVVATGGTLARKWIMDIKPKAIVAVACERDLSSGISDMKGLPVLGVLNDRPNGPCIDTRVSIDKLEEAIKFFIGE